MGWRKRSTSSAQRWFHGYVHLSKLVRLCIVNGCSLLYINYTSTNLIKLNRVSKQKACVKCLTFFLWKWPKGHPNSPLCFQDERKHCQWTPLLSVYPRHKPRKALPYIMSFESSNPIKEGENPLFTAERGWLCVILHRTFAALRATLYIPTHCFSTRCLLWW